MMKKKLALILAMSLFLGSSLSVFADQAESPENILIEDTQETEEIQETQEIQSKQKQIILQLDSTLAWIDGLEYTLAARPKVIEGRTYLPLRFMADMLLEAEVHWDGPSKKVTIIKDEKKVEVTIGNQKAHINGDQIEIQNPPIIDNSLTYLPLRAIAELFEIQANYDEPTRRITLTKVQDGSFKPVVTKPPVAQFSFDQESYTAGQQVKPIDQSFHEDKLPITNKLWMINFDESKTNIKLENMFSKPNAGNYLVSLKVEAGKGNWSEWTTREITIKPNQKPVITSLTPTKESYAGGELIDFTYTYENESWEGIKMARWTYRQAGEVMSKAVVEKPQYIFQQGRYIITLQLQDDYNNWSEPQETIVNIGSERLQTELEYRFTNGISGDTIDNFDNFNYLQYDTVESDETSFENGALIISNSPENVRANGILYRDTVSGQGRILLHHHNSFTDEENAADPKRIVLVAENTSNEPLSFTLSNRAEKGPSTDILFVGQQLLYDYLKGSPPKTYFLRPGEKTYIYDSGTKKWDKGKLISVQMDFNVTGRLNLTTAAIGQSTTIDQVKELPELAKDAHPRGTFDTINIYHKLKIDNDKPTRLILGAGTSEWVNGYDAMTGEATQNRGNFAVTYKIQITAEEDTGIMLNPRAGLFRGALKWDKEEPFLAPSKGYIMGYSSKGVKLGLVKAGETRTLEYSLPNGSASPVLLVFMPKDHWNH